MIKLKIVLCLINWYSKTQKDWVLTKEIYIPCIVDKINLDGYKMEIISMVWYCKEQKFVGGANITLAGTPHEELINEFIASGWEIL